MTFTNTSRMQLVGGLWCGAALLALACSAALGATWSTSMLVLILFAVPLGVAVMIGLGAQTETVAELLHSVNEAPTRG